MISIKRADYDDIIYSINEENKTASVIGCYTNYSKITIPKSIQYKSSEYIVTSILRKAFKSSPVNTIQFSNDSELEMIEREAFKDLPIENFTIPSKLKELKEGWCTNLTNLNNINVSPDNQYFSLYEDNIIIGKSSINEPNYDLLVFSVRDIKTATIPKFIKHICSYSFERCKRLKQISFENESNLQTIEKFAFNKSSIESITIPSQVSIIGKNAFYYCSRFQKIEFEINSNLQQIEQNAFSGSSIEKIKIPSQTTVIHEKAFYQCKKLRKIEIGYDSKLQTIGKHAFFLTQIGSITIPPLVTKIEKYAFSYCDKMKIIEVIPNYNNDNINQLKIDAPFNTIVMFPANSTYWSYFDYPNSSFEGFLDILRYQ